MTTINPTGQQILDHSNSGGLVLRKHKDAYGGAESWEPMSVGELLAVTSPASLRTAQPGYRLEPRSSTEGDPQP